MKGGKKVFAIIPACNEMHDISDIIKRTKKYVDKVIVVDDGSSDLTYENAKAAGADVLRHVVNMGKGAALKTGCDYAFKNKADIIILLDADGQHNPEDIPSLMKELKSKDIVFSFRKFNCKMPALLRFGNNVINGTISLLFGIRLKDTQCGFRAFKREIYHKIRWKSADYTIESEMVAYTAKNRLRYSEVPIKTIYCNKYKGTTAFDGIRIVLNIFLFKIRVRR